jgi:sugar lactone lactonase YvrE
LSTADSRLNDGACDPAGAFLVGSMALDDRTGGESLVRVERDGSLTVLDDDLTLSNGLAWSPDGGLLYSIDTVPGVVWVRPYAAGTGAVGPRTAFLRFSDTSPDGMCVDAEGAAWIACWGAGEVRRFSPAGELIGVVEVAAPQVTSVAFAGPGLDRLVITTASAYLSPQRLARHPDSGRLFLADVGAVGRAPTPWAGAGP